MCLHVLISCSKIFDKRPTKMYSIYSFDDCCLDSYIVFGSFLVSEHPYSASPNQKKEILVLLDLYKTDIINLKTFIMKSCSYSPV